MLCSTSVHAPPAAEDYRDHLDSPVLLLNRSYVPLRLATARRAFILLYGGVARALDLEGELFDFGGWSQLSASRNNGIATSRGWIRVPRVLHLERYDRLPQRHVRLTRRNLFLRDNYECQYCGARPGTKGLSLDHVVPRSRGGNDCWANLVICCRRCNLRKRDRTPQEAGMRLCRAPQPPPWSPIDQIRMSARVFFPEWTPYLGEVPSAPDVYRRAG